MKPHAGDRFKSCVSNSQTNYQTIGMLYIYITIGNLMSGSDFGFRSYVQKLFTKFCVDGRGGDELESVFDCKLCAKVTAIHP